MNKAAENLQDTFNETMGEMLAEHQNKDIQEAEKMAYGELKPNYLSQLIPRYKYMVGMTAALKKDPVHQRILRIAKRLREEVWMPASETTCPIWVTCDIRTQQRGAKKPLFIIEIRRLIVVHANVKYFNLSYKCSYSMSAVYHFYG